MKGMRIVWVGLLVAVVMVAALFLFSRPREGRSGEQPLMLYCAAGIKSPVEELARRFEQKYGVLVQIQYGGSGTLLSNIEVSRKGDLYIAADDSYMDIASRKGLIAERLPLARQRPVIAVPHGNPGNIRELNDLLRPDLRLALGNPEAASIGRQTQRLLERAGIWEAVRLQTEKRGVFKPTVMELKSDLMLGAVDAAVLWDALVAQHPTKLEAVRVPLFDEAVQDVSVGVLVSSEQPTAALRFARWLSSDIGNEVFRRFKFESSDGDKWAWRPEITFFCGSISRRGVGEALKTFAQREGVDINTIYNGCGILTAQMRMIRQGQGGGVGFPDVYMACDHYYLDNVKEWFQEDVDLSDAHIVIAVPKGNPKNIRSLSDLTQPGMRVSVGQPEQSTIGALTRIMLGKYNLFDPVMSNVVMQTASSAMLVPTVSTRSVDAAIAYITDTLAEADKVDTIKIDSPFARAVQPFAIARCSKNKHLGRRLFAEFAKAREVFETAGFGFLIECESDKCGIDKVAKPVVEQPAVAKPAVVEQPAVVTQPAVVEQPAVEPQPEVPQP